MGQKLVVVVDGLALFSWNSQTLDIHIPQAPKLHQPKILNAKGEWVPLSNGSHRIDPAPPPGKSGPPEQGHLVLDPAVVRPVPGKSVFSIRGLSWPSAVLGDKRYLVAPSRLLKATPPGILKKRARATSRPQPVPVGVGSLCASTGSQAAAVVTARQPAPGDITVCARTYLVYDGVAKASLVEVNGKQQYAPVPQENGNLLIALLSHQLGAHEHGQLFNNMLQMVGSGAPPDLDLTTTDDPEFFGSDPEVASLELTIPPIPEVPQPLGAGHGGRHRGARTEAIDGTGCGQGHTGN